MINLLIKILKKRGRESSVLLNAVSFSKTGNEYLIEKLYEAGDDIELDFNILNKQLIKYVYEQNQENKEQCKSNIQHLNQMRSKIENQIDELKNEYERKTNEIEEKQIRFKNDMMISMMDQIETIKKEMNNMRQEMKEQQMISEKRNTSINKNIELGKSTNFIIMNNIKKDAT
ncbi:hypothetical protein M9Y10_027791 [Tritrichomonas musculus]|uniref:Uncharacterized protein n=1 Tax=Tritrichomonas musculus TaxID=1915356 RepID=A0ABR2H5B4_9EUKA